jgi:hypothetical protein
MPTGIISLSASIAGLQVTGGITATDDGQIGQEFSLAAGISGSLTTRTDNDTGEATLAGGHGLAQSDVVDVYWASGVRYGMTVGTVDVNVVPLDGGAGDNLPTQSTALVVCKQSTVDIDVDGDLLSLILCASNRRAHFDFQEAAGTSIKALALAAGGVWFWNSGDTTNPFAGKVIGQLTVSNGDAANAATLKIGCLYNSLA